jgi:hypothetical protein
MQLNFDSKFLLIGTGQNSLSETSLLQRLQDRFTVKVSLSDADVETVTRKLFRKKPTAISLIDKKLEASLGEISEIFQVQIMDMLQAIKQPL